MTDKVKTLFFDDRKSPVVFLKKHPVLITFVAVVLLSAVTFCEQNYISPGNMFFMLAGFVVISFAVSALLYAYYGVKNIYCLIFFLFSCAMSYLFLKYLYGAERKAGYIYIVGIVGLLSVFLYLTLRKKMTAERFVILLFIAGVLIRFMYVLYTSRYTRQHDVGNFDAFSGHAGYIHYIYENGHLPDFDVSTVDQFYHPPLHHIICALWWKMLASIGIADAYAQSSIQTLTLFYSSVSLILSYKIFRQFDLKGAALVAAFAVMAFHPTFIIFAGSINNDILSVTFMLLAVLYSIKWYKSRKFGDIMVIALAVGLGMMTKTSAYMVAFGIGLLFFVAMIKDKANFKKYLVQFICFAVVCVPLALWWNIKNSVLYDLPIAYVQRQGAGAQWQYVGDKSFVERVFDFSKLFEAPVFDQWTNRGGKVYNEYNPMISLLKTSVFGEYIHDYSYPSITFAANVLFWSNLVLAVLGAACLVYAAIKMIMRKEWDHSYLSLMITFVLMMMFYYTFCFAYPHHCTENIRYVSPVILLGTLFIGRTLTDLKDERTSPPVLAEEGEQGETVAPVAAKQPKWLTVCTYALCALVIIFCLSSSTMFLQIALA